MSSAEATAGQICTGKEEKEKEEKEEEDWHEEEGEEEEEEETAVRGSAAHTHTPVSLNIGRAAELSCRRRSLCNIAAARQIVQLLSGDCVC